MSEFETRAIHVAQNPDDRTGGVIPPIHMTTTHKQDGVGNLRNGFEYNRAANPTRSALQEALASLEGGRFAMSFSSGLAAEDAIIRAALKPGDHVILANDMYGGSYRLFAKVYQAWGIDFSIVELSDEVKLEAAFIAGRTKMVWIETPSNPMMTIFDIAKISAIAHKHNAIAVVDNTFATPYLQRPLELGADVVFHSTTKYLGGHSDVLGGAVILNDGELAKKIEFIQFAVGAVSSPFDAWLTHRSIKTLALRMERHCFNAESVANYLVAQTDLISAVYYPGLEDHPGHEIAKKQMNGFGGMLSMKFVGGKSAALKFCESTHLFTLAESLGGVESLINYPAEMTHATANGTPLEVADDIVRLSVGVEHISDILADLSQALDQL
ncbi:MAG: cystathionine gamma-synthase [Micrococcales bacterium]|nr:cystathionine gamma-synthase [Micrococcales bacterium]NBR62334.1 cystathionine gamma-synthase [Actinomycetota bacterium]